MSKTKGLSTAAVVCLVAFVVLFCVAWLAVGTGVVRVSTERDNVTGSSVRVNVAESGYVYARTGGTYYGPVVILVTRDYGALGVERDAVGVSVIASRRKP